MRERQKHGKENRQSYKTNESEGRKKEREKERKKANRR